MRTTAYAGLVGAAPIASLVFFDYTDALTEDALMHGVGKVALEMQDLKASLLAPVTRAQPTISVENNTALRARAWAEEVRGGTGACVHAIVVNTANGFQSIDAAITGAATALPHRIAATLPFEGDADRRVNVTGGALHDMIAPNSVNVYRIGCAVPPPDPRNLSPNPSFEEPGLLGGVSGWSNGRAGWFGADGHDLRARMFLDTTRPQHGRYALRVTVPSAEPLPTMWSTSSAQNDVYHTDGYQLDGNTDYFIRLWARSNNPGGMKLEVLTGHWAVNAKEQAGFHTVGTYVRNETLASAVVNSTWQRIVATVPAAGCDRAMQLQFSGGPGMMFIDNTFIANVTARGGLKTDDCALGPGA